MSATEGIGTAKEKGLHAALKAHYCGPDGTMETEVGIYVCDVKRSDGEIIEVQTGNFAPAREKFIRLAGINRIRIVHPIVVSRVIDLFDSEGIRIRTRRSPKKGSEWDLFRVLVGAPLLPLTPNLSIEVVFVEEKETRISDGRGSWRRGGVSVVERDLLSIHGTLHLPGAESFSRFLPEGLDEQFGTTELAKACSIRPDLARKVLYVLNRMGLIHVSGKKGNAKLYRKSQLKVIPAHY
jgi:hypothetical protein